MEHHDLLIEILTEELPPKRLPILEHAFAQSIHDELKQSGLDFLQVKSYASPRRLAVYVEKLSSEQAPQNKEYLGPNVKLAFNAEKELSAAGLGFIKKYGLNKDQIKIIHTDKGDCLYYCEETAGQSIDQLLPKILQQVFKSLPIPKPMRWGNYDFSFIRPVHSIILLYGERVISGEFFGKLSQRGTYGHRQLSHKKIEISFPINYTEELEDQGCVIVDSKKRKQIILDQIHSILKNLSEEKIGQSLKIAISSEKEYEQLLDEVTSLVEWPQALLCHFDEIFLTIPKEVLITSMQSHQKCFAISDEKGNLLPYFITISNLDSEDESAIIKGNERVMRARLSDARFFYESDLKASLLSFSPLLKNTIYQEKLGTLEEKINRIEKLIPHIIENLSLNHKEYRKEALLSDTKKAALLSKLDLFSHMVGEFPELQGIIGKYYAQEEGQPAAISQAIEEHYWPRFAEDQIPSQPLSLVLALADRLDTITGFFSIELRPTGDKDPFGLKRAALAVLRIILENQLSLDLAKIIEISEKAFNSRENQSYVMPFFIERFKTLALEKNITLDVFHSVMNIPFQSPWDALLRMIQVQEFKKNPACETLIKANKRVKNILTKNKIHYDSDLFDDDLCEYNIEADLYNEIHQIKEELNSLVKKSDYFNALLKLAKLKPYVDAFFNEVMIMTDDLNKRHNRFIILKKLQELLLYIADFSELQL